VSSSYVEFLVLVKLSYVELCRVAGTKSRKCNFGLKAGAAINLKKVQELQFVAMARVDKLMG
jgi:hypothetical protein